MNSSSALSRREALIGLVALFGGGVLAAPSVAAASTGTMQYGAANNAGTSNTGLTSSSVNGTLYLEASGTSAGSSALAAVSSAAASQAPTILAATFGLGPAVSAELDGPASATAPAVLATSNSQGPGVRGVANSSAQGHGVEGLIQSASNASAALHGATSGTGPAVLAETTGTGPAIEGLVTDADSSAPAATIFNGGHGYGLQVNAMNNAQIRIVPSAVTGPPTSGDHHLGDLFMDAAGVLYRCSVSGTPGSWVPVGSGVPVAATRLSVGGVASFSRAGRGSIGKGKTSATVAVPSGISASSLILVTLQNSPGNVLVKYAARVDATHFKVVLSKAATGTTYFSWFVVG